MTTALLSWKEMLPASARTWNSFFHVPVDVRLLTILRVTYAAVVLINILCWWPDLESWFGEAGVLPWDAANQLRDPAASTLFAWIPASSTVLWFCYSLFILQTVLLLLGIFPRLQAACVFAWLVSFIHRQPLLWDSEDQVMRLIGFYLIFAPLQVTAFVSFPRVFSWQTNASPVSNAVPSGWAIRLIQLQMCVIFLAAAFAKLQGDTWLDGTAVYYAARLDEFAARGGTPQFLFDTPWIVRFLTWGTIAIEAFVPVCLWFRETRRGALFVALLFHLGCLWSMNLFLFHWIMLCGWSAFLSSEDVDFFTAAWKKILGKKS